MFPSFNLDKGAHLMTWKMRFDLEFSDSSESATGSWWPGESQPRRGPHFRVPSWTLRDMIGMSVDTSVQASSVTTCSPSAKQLPLDRFRRRACADSGNRFGAIWEGKFGVPNPQSGGQAQSEHSSLAPQIPCPMRQEEDQSRAKIIFKF